MTSDAAKATPRPRPPAALGDAGKGFWKAFTGSYIFSPAELQVLTLAAAQADDVAQLEAIVAEGMVVLGSQGQPRLNQAVAELRQARLAQARLIGQLAIPDEDDRPRTSASERGRRAAQARWNQEGTTGGVA